MADLIAMAKRSAQPLTFATAGVGTSNHLAGELLAQVADIKLTPVPYKGQPEALNDMLAGRVTLMPLTSALALGHMRSGKLKGLAVTTAKRSHMLDAAWKQSVRQGILARMSHNRTGWEECELQR